MQRITPLPPHFAGVEQSWFTGLFLFRDTVALLINPGWLLSQTMDAFVAQSLPEQTAPGEQPVPDQAAAAPAGAPAPSRKKGRRKPVVTASGEEAALEVLENLVLEESADAEDSQTPWADA